jgi:hypothetical protein
MARLDFSANLNYGVAFRAQASLKIDTVHFLQGLILSRQRLQVFETHKDRKRATDVCGNTSVTSQPNGGSLCK